ncbi:hypothetical protein BC936DRAFT_149845 [Jimgerdemannia flammicorona]|uniref:Uncharacterized protein n=1 Tax=Jimgerdemannia flammicorona TaxID=994334 RepID=A0A433D015_9FUNG|nr:hypothetical protein BC936DRAFT_149845 [Jimgerdemannia flammicorona]
MQRTPDQYVPLISPVREFSSDLEFLKSFPENAAALHELETMINEFVETYIYVRGWATSTVEKIQNIYQKVKKVLIGFRNLNVLACLGDRELWEIM